MCEKKQFRYCPSTIDECMKPLIEFLKGLGYDTIACCCGHSRYPMTIVARPQLFPERKWGKVVELLSGAVITRKKKFYKKDKQGYYYIPEVSETKDE